MANTKTQKKALKQVRKSYKAARELVANRRTWTQGYLAHDKYGHPCEATDKFAVRWCAVGALIHVNPDLADTAADTAMSLDYLTDAAMSLYGASPSSVNDGKGGHKAAIACYDRAIEDISLRIKEL